MSNQFSNKYTEKDYIKKCEELNLVYIGNHKDKKKGTIIEFLCKKHENKGVQNKDWSHLKTSKYGCSYCYGRNKTNEDIIKDIKDKNVELISEYTGNEKPIDCKCKLCGFTWTTLPKVLMTNGSGCPECGKIKAANSRRKTTAQFVEELENINKDIKIIGEYFGTHSKIKCKCRICGTVWYGYPANLLNKSAGCPGCNISTGEKMLLDALCEIGIDFTPQFPIDDNKHKRNLRFDAYDERNKIAFEYNGEQHYFPVDFAGKGEEWAKQQFNLTIERDNSKYEYCKTNNIPIIIVSYWEKENMKQIIISKIEEMKLEIA